MSNVRIDFRKVTPFKIEIKILIDDKVAIQETVDLNPEFFDEETADMYARMLAMIMQMSVGMFRNFFGSSDKEP